MPSGEQIAAFRRPGYRGEPDTELRVSLDVVNGNPFITLRTWQAGRGGTWWPTPKGVTIKIKEADGVGAALIDALALADDDAAIRRIAARNEAIKRGDGSGGSPAYPRREPARQAPPPARSAAPAQNGRGVAPWEGASEFDEFSPSGGAS